MMDERAGFSLAVLSFAGLVAAAMPAVTHSQTAVSEVECVSVVEKPADSIFVPLEFTNRCPYPVHVSACMHERDPFGDLVITCQKTRAALRAGVLAPGKKYTFSGRTDQRHYWYSVCRAEGKAEEDADNQCQVYTDTGYETLFTGHGDQKRQIYP